MKPYPKMSRILLFRLARKAGLRIEYLPNGPIVMSRSNDATSVVLWSGDETYRWDIGQGLTARITLAQAALLLGLQVGIQEK
jgi:hypothetical protein